MAAATDIALRQQVMYSVFVRNYSKAGNFEGVRRDLRRIKDLGVDIIWLMPIHPIGEKCRKGRMGSPYAIKDFRAVNPDFGTEEDLRRLVNDAHGLGMRVIIDVVYNHTSPDSVLAVSHPEWFYHKSDGSLGNRIGEWYDVVDLDYRKQELWDYQIDTLKKWAGIVDGFRCDVASLIPLEFWLRARRKVAEVNPKCLWLAESIHRSFLIDCRANGIPASSDAELYQAFDICYDYDVFDGFSDYLTGHGSLDHYARVISSQEAIYPANYVKLRFLENHDQPRAHYMIPDARALRNWTAFSFFEKGTALVYAGQEIGESHLPELFEKDPIDWDHWEVDLTEFIKKLSAIRRQLDARGVCRVRAEAEKYLIAERKMGGKTVTGVFAVTGLPGVLRTNLTDGIYDELISGKKIRVRHQMISCTGEPMILRCAEIIS